MVVRVVRVVRVLAVLAVLAGVTSLAGPAGSEAFPGANGKIAFVSSVGAGKPDVYVMNADGTSPVNLTNNAAWDDSPSWSPDGSRLAFMSDRSGNNEVWVMNADGTSPVNLTNNAALDSGPTWSPDGTRIAFNSRRSGNDEVWVMNADGTSPVNLTNNAAQESGPSWSPDGTRIAFNSSRDGNSEVYVMNADGTSAVNLTNNAAMDGNPSWSPDGTKIAFFSDGDGTLTNLEVYVMDADGTSPVNLTNTAAWEMNPSWSPDGTKIAFTSQSPGYLHEVYVMNADGTSPVNLTNNPQGDYDPSWQSLPIVPASVSGLVTEEGSGGLLGGISVTVRSTPGGVAYKTKTQPDGSWSVAGLPPGGYTVKFRDLAGGAYLEEFYNDTGYPPSATVVDLASGEDEVGIDAALTPVATKGSIAGTVTASDGADVGEPLGGMTVVLFTDGLSKITKVKTAPDGSWVIPNLDPGNYKVKIRDVAGWYVDEWFDDTASNLADPVTVTAGATTTADAALHCTCV